MLYGYTIGSSPLLAATGGDLVVLVVAIIGSSGLGGLVTAWLGLKKFNADNAEREAGQEAQIKTVAAAEAEAAMRIMGASVARLQDEVLTLTNRVRACEQHRADHALVCPLLGGRQ